MADRAGASTAARPYSDAALIVLLVLPCIIGRISTYFIVLLLLIALVRAGAERLFRTRRKNIADGLFTASFVILALSALASATDPADLAYIGNFLPFLLLGPVRWLFDDLARPDDSLRLMRFALWGSVGSLGFAVVQVAVFRLDRVGQPLMNPFQFADTALLLGFLALGGVFLPGPHRRWPFLFGPVAGIMAVLLSGTRGALLALPVLGVTAFGMALMRSPHRRIIGIIGLAVITLATSIVVLAPEFGLERSAGAFKTIVSLIAGAPVDESTRQRLVIYSGALAAFWRSPIVGYGWGDMVPAIFPYVPADMLPIVRTFRQLHNGIFSFGVGSGVLGLVAFIALSVAPVVAVLRTPRDARFDTRLYLALVLAGGYQVFQFTFILLGYEFHSIQYVVVTALILGYVRDARGSASG